MLAFKEALAKQSNIDDREWIISLPELDTDKHRVEIERANRVDQVATYDTLIKGI
jgi:hypothetical protein